MKTEKEIPLINVVRVPGENGEWIDLHEAKDGAIWITTSGYTKINPLNLVRGLERLRGSLV